MEGWDVIEDIRSRVETEKIEIDGSSDVDEKNELKPERTQNFSLTLTINLNVSGSGK